MILQRVFCVCFDPINLFCFDMDCPFDYTVFSRLVEMLFMINILLYDQALTD